MPGGSARDRCRLEVDCAGRPHRRVVIADEDASGFTVARVRGSGRTAGVELAVSPSPHPNLHLRTFP
jgi:hypothetical protein